MSKTNIKLIAPSSYYHNPVDIENGFCNIVFTDGRKEFSLQACLNERISKDEQDRYKMIEKCHLYKKEITENDSGFNWGLSGECNEYAVEKYGEEFCYNLFKKEAKKLGVRFV